jgi:3D (Asp-Asp-Asp) domain-containing protein
MNIASIALTGFFVWSSVASSSVLTTQTAAVTIAEPVAPISIAPAKTISVMLTGYNAVPEQTDGDPFTTASGAYSNPEVIAAVSRDLRYGALPFGTVIALESHTSDNNCGFGVVEHLIGYRVVADQMHERWEKKIDVLLDEKDVVMIGVNGQSKKAVNPARALGKCRNITARVVGRIDIKEIPKSQSELAMRVERTLAAK